MTHAAPTPAIWYANKRVWRTVFSAILTGAVVVPQLLLIVSQSWPSETLSLVLAQSLIVQGFITKVMANETVNLWLSHIGLGSAPRAELLK